MGPGICNTFCRPLNVSARAEARHAVAPMFFFADFSKSIPDTDIMFSLKVAQDPRLHFRRKKFFKKFRLHGFFSKEVLKNAFFDNFSSLISYISELRPNTMSMVSYIVQAFYRLHFRLRITSKNFFILGVFWQKRGQKIF